MFRIILSYLYNETIRAMQRDHVVLTKKLVTASHIIIIWKNIIIINYYIIFYLH